MRLATPLICALAGLLFWGGCATSEPEFDDDNGDAGQGDTGDVYGTDGDGGNDDTGMADTDVDAGDPCDQCGDDETCVADSCVDLCADSGLSCGSWELEGHQVDCGSCPAGECDDGHCPDICAVFQAQCGEVYWQGNRFECDSCAGIDRCMNNQCTSSEGFIALAAGYAHSCGLRSNGEVRCWGRNESGQLGDNNQPIGSSSPERVRDLNTAVRLASRNNHSCSVRTDEHVYCWGSNGSGRLGDGSTDDAPTAVHATGVTATAVTAGGEYSCALLTSQEVLCWGDNEHGQLARGIKSSDPTFDHDKRRVLLATEDELDHVIDLSAGSSHSCAVDHDNSLWCWGNNLSGQLGRGDNFDAPAYAQPVVDIPPVHRVGAGFLHSCAIAVGGDLYCWGRGNEGQIGDGHDTNRFEPTEVELDEPVIDVATGQFHTCAVTDSGSLYCWGRNTEGQLGQGFKSQYIADPMEVTELDDMVAVVAGSAHSCALQRSGQAYCWGQNSEGQLGDGSEQAERTTPVPVD